jgi:hypothetical protein
MKGEDDRAIANRPQGANELKQKLSLPCPYHLPKILKSEQLASAVASHLSTLRMLFLGMANIGKGSAIENVGGRIPHRKKNAE